jgi:hypothetical protein
VCMYKPITAGAVWNMKYLFPLFGQSRNRFFIISISIDIVICMLIRRVVFFVLVENFEKTKFKHGSRIKIYSVLDWFLFDNRHTPCCLAGKCN